MIQARAPLRISFGGGGTDVPPYPELYGGAVLSATIDKFAYAVVDGTAGGNGTADGRTRIHCPDLAATAALAERVELADVVLSGRTGVDGARISMWCDAPPGSGLGSSSSLIVALTAALNEVERRQASLYDLAAEAVRLEREELGVPGGLQDQYAAAFGGFNFIEFDAHGVLVTPLRLRPELMAELHGSLVMIPAPATQRRSSGLLHAQIAKTAGHDEDALQRLGFLRELADRMKSVLLRGDLLEMGELLHEGWMSKRDLVAGITTDAINDVYEQARTLGATGGKLLGAGGGGFLLLMTPFERRGDLVRRLRDRGIEPVTFSFVHDGAYAWRKL